MSETAPSLKDTNRPTQVYQDLRAFPSTVVMLSTLFVAALLTIVCISYIYIRLTKIEGFNTDDWESWAFFLQTTLGLGMTVAGVVATVWIAFRVEAIARRQVANDDREHDMALLRTEVVEPAKAATGPFFEALTRSRKASYLIQKIETDVDNWQYHKINKLYPIAHDDISDTSSHLDLVCRNCHFPIRKQKAEQTIDNEMRKRKYELTRPYKQVLRRSFADMCSVLDNLKRRSDINLLSHIPKAQREIMADHVEAYLNHMWPRDDLFQSTENFVNALKRRVEAMGEKGSNRPTHEEAPTLFFEICKHHEGRDLERNTPQGGEADPLENYDEAFWRTKFLNSQVLPNDFEINFHIGENKAVVGNMAQVLEASLLYGMCSLEAFETRLASYLKARAGVLNPDKKTRLLCWSEYRSALLSDSDGLTTGVILGDMNRQILDIPHLQLRTIDYGPNDVYPDVIAQEDDIKNFVSKLSKNPIDTCVCSNPVMALGD